MSTLNQIKCDLCNAILKDNEVAISNNILNIGNKPKSKYNLNFTYDGQLRKGDLCLVCARKLRDTIEDIKEGKK